MPKRTGQVETGRKVCADRPGDYDFPQQVSGRLAHDGDLGLLREGILEAVSKPVGIGVPLNDNTRGRLRLLRRGRGRTAEI